MEVIVECFGVWSRRLVAGAGNEEEGKSVQKVGSVVDRLQQSRSFGRCSQAASGWNFFPEAEIIPCRLSAQSCCL
jgi:hypothetical protein